MKPQTLLPAQQRQTLRRYGSRTGKPVMYKLLGSGRLLRRITLPLPFRGSHIRLGAISIPRIQRRQPHYLTDAVMASHRLRVISLAVSRLLHFFPQPARVTVIRCPMKRAAETAMAAEYEFIHHHLLLALIGDRLPNNLYRTCAGVFVLELGDAGGGQIVKGAPVMAVISLGHRIISRLRWYAAALQISPCGQGAPPGIARPFRTGRQESNLQMPITRLLRPAGAFSVPSIPAWAGECLVRELLSQPKAVYPRTECWGMGAIPRLLRHPPG